MKIYIWQHSWSGDPLDGTPVYEWSSNKDDIPYVHAGDIELRPTETQIDSVVFVQEHIVWDIHKSTYDNFQTNTEVALAVTDYARAHGFYKYG